MAVPTAPEAWQPVLKFWTNPLIVMLLSLGIATYTLGLSRGMKIQPLMDDYGNSVKDIAVILLIIAGAGTLKEVFVATGVDKNISAALTGIAIDPLILGWLIAGVIRVSLGSATVAGMTAAGLMAPVVATGNVDPNLMVLAVGAGSLMFSHVNDSGFWMAKEYFNLSLKETLKSWTLMEGIVGIVGIIGVLILEAVDQLAPLIFRQTYLAADSIEASSLAENSRLLSAPTASSTCATLLAPINEDVTCLCRNVQARPSGQVTAPRFASSLSFLLSRLWPA
jgi:hypothetical protein